MRPRQRFGEGITGDVLEVGPGHVPFPTGAGARVRYADRPIEGGRDRNFPELAGTPWGPPTDFDVDLDRAGLDGVADGSLDAVVASHVVEHLAAPVTALVEFERTLRPGGRTVLILPLRQATFDRNRRPTPLTHLLEEYDGGVREVSAEHIREFCAAIHVLPPFLPTEVAGWHDPDRLDDELLALHRRRSIHVHCWDAEELAATVAGLTARGILHPRLLDSFFPGDDGAEDMEFGLVLARAETGDPAVLAASFVDDWVRAVLDDERRDPARVAAFAAALVRDAPDTRLAERAVGALAAGVQTARGERRALDEQVVTLRAELVALRAELVALRTGPAHRVGAAVTAPVRLVRRVRADRAGPGSR